MIKHRVSQLDLKFTRLSTPFEQMLDDFLESYREPVKSQHLKVTMHTLNDIPEYLCAEWTCYIDILYHLVQNAVKFSKPGGHIKIILAYVDCFTPLDNIEENRSGQSSE